MKIGKQMNLSRMIIKKNLLSCSSYNERSKFPLGLNATETATWPLSLPNCEENEISDTCLKKNDGFSEEIVWFNGEESGENGLMEAIEVVLAKVEGLCCLFCFLWVIYFRFWPSVF
ncbi:hypothetical protein Hanom_Chr09g00774861 [Helianthus anomalus]